MDRPATGTTIGGLGIGHGWQRVKKYRSVGVRCIVWDFQEVKNIEYRGEYIYYICFDDGVAGVLDFSEFLGKGPVFKALQNPILFNQAIVAGGTIAWPNGADIAPETLYEKIIEKSKFKANTA